MVREAEKCGIPSHLGDGEGICGTNYQKLDHFDLSKFGAVILDESSILKSTDGHYRTKLIQSCQSIPFRLAATATPAPNDIMELGNHAEFLGVMKYTDKIGRASCRESVCKFVYISVVAVSLKIKQTQSSW